MTLTREWTVNVPGRPIPKGSLRHIGRGRLVDQLPGLDAWRNAIATMVRSEIHEQADPQQAIFVGLTFALERPKTAVKRSLPSGGRSKDIDKLSRAVLDALQDSRLLPDDAQVTDLYAVKRYAYGPPYLTIAVRPLEKP